MTNVESHEGTTESQSNSSTTTTSAFITSVPPEEITRQLSDKESPSIMESDIAEISQVHRKESKASSVPKKGVGVDDSAEKLEGNDDDLFTRGDVHKAGVVPRKGVIEDMVTYNVTQTKNTDDELQTTKMTSTSSEMTTSTQPAAPITTDSSTASPSTPFGHLHSAQVPDPEITRVKVDNTPNASLLVGLIFGLMLLSVIGFLVYRKADAARRRREYQRMNDFLIDGMYNDL